MIFALSPLVAVVFESESLQLLAGMNHSAVVDTHHRQKDFTASCYSDVCLAGALWDVDIDERRSIFMAIRSVEYGRLLYR